MSDTATVTGFYQRNGREDHMAGARFVAWAVIAVMAALAVNIILNDGFDHGAGLDVFLAGTASPWQLFINQDLVSGLWIACAWVIHRQRGSRIAETVAWIWMILWWGNIVVAAYILVALRQAEGDPGRFFAGARGGSLPRIWQPGAAARLILAAGALLTLGLLAALLARAANGVAVAGMLLGFLPITLSLLLLALPRRLPVDGGDEAVHRG